MSDTKKIPLFMSSNYTMEIAAENPTHLFVFSDNLVRAGTGKDSGQAVIRNASNSIGIATKRAPNNKPESFFSDKKEEVDVAKADISALVVEIKSGKWDAVVFPSNGFGTGRANLEKHAPKTMDIINKMLEQVKTHLLEVAGDLNAIPMESKIETEEVGSAFYVLARDNLGRDYHNDKLVGVFQSKAEAEAYCDENNNESAPSFNLVVDDLNDINLESYYDINGETPSFEAFLSMTGLGLISKDEAASFFSGHYGVDPVEAVVLAVVGSRGFADRDLLFSTLSAMHKNGDFTSIVSGGAKGPDSFAEEWARENNVEILILEPDWEKHGKAAGFVRNVEIWDNAHKGIAFWDGKSKGTAHSFEIAEKQGKHIITVLSVPQELKIPVIVEDAPIAVCDPRDTAGLDDNLPDYSEDEVDLLLKIPTMSKEEKRVEAENPNIDPLVAEALACSAYPANKALWFNPSVPDNVKLQLKEHFDQFPRLYDDAFYHFYDKEKPLFTDDEGHTVDESRGMNP